MKEYNAGDKYYIVYGKVTYTHFFKVPHWTHFCAWVAAPPKTTEMKAVKAKRCTLYNDVDDN